MGAGIAAGAFMDGFYKGYSLMDKSRKEKEELKLKEDKAKQELETAAKELDSKMASQSTATTQKINEYNTQEAKAYADGDLELVNTARNNKLNLINAFNNELDIAKKNSGKDFERLPIKQGDVEKVTTVEHLGNKYTVLESDRDAVADVIKKQPNRVKVTPDGRLSIYGVNETTGDILDTRVASYDMLQKKEDKTGKDTDMMFAWKEHNSNLPEGETPISLPDFKALHWDKPSTSTEQTYTDAKTRLASGKYTDDAIGNAKKLADIAIVNKYEKTGQFAPDKTGTWGTQINPVTGEIIQTNSKTGSIKTVGQTITPKQAEAEAKAIEGKAAIDEIEVQLNLMEGLYKKEGTAITSFGEHPGAFILNKANDIIKLPTKDRAIRAQAQQFSDAVKIAVASAAQPGALTQKDVDSFAPFIISPDDDEATIKEKITGQRSFIARNKKKIEAGLNIYNQQNKAKQTEEPKVVKTWSDATYKYRQYSNGKIQKAKK